MTRGVFITLEGGEGAGKSVNLEWCGEYVRARGREAVLTREPGGTPLGERLRALLLHGETRLATDTELMLMFAARMQHLIDVIHPALRAGKVVICDRFTDASFAYQGGGRGVPAARIAALEEWVQQGLTPDRTLLFDLPVEVGLARARKRASADRIEREDAAFFARVRAAYLARAQAEPRRFRLVDAAQSLTAVQRQLGQYLDEVLR